MPYVPLRGQWNARGSGSLASALTRSDGTSLYTDFQGNIIPAGTVVAAWGGNTSGLLTGMYGAWAQGGVWDTTRNQWLSFGSNMGDPQMEINVFDIEAAIWNPNVTPYFGRPQRVYAKYISHNNDSSVNYVAPGFPNGYGGGGPSAGNAPAFFIDKDGLYPDLTEINPIYGLSLLPNVGHHMGGPLWMPSVQRVLYPGTFGVYTSDLGGTTDQWEWNPATRKWSLNVEGNNKLGPLQSPLASAWDTRRNRALILAGSDEATGYLYAYDPTAAMGSRMTLLHPSSIRKQLPGEASMCYDSKRDCVRVYGTENVYGGSRASFFFSSNGGTANAPVRIAFTTTGLQDNIQTAGLIYDPIADRDVFWFGGEVWVPGSPPSGDARTLWVLNPDSNVAQPLQSGPVTPDRTATLQLGVTSVWNRFAYLPTYDAYALIPTPNTQGAFIFAPDRTSGLLAAAGGAQVYSLTLAGGVYGLTGSNVTLTPQLLPPAIMKLKYRRT